MSTVTPEQVKEIGRCQKLLPTESDFIGRKGYWRKPKDPADPGGAYEWGFRYRPNVRGKPTKTQQEMVQRMRPFMRADVERHAKLEAAKERVALKDKDGQVRLVDPGLADQAARRNGWTHSFRARGNVEAGVGGMLWRRCVGGDWEPLGVTCLGTPICGKAEVPRRGTQQDPDGNPWRYVAREWRRVA